MHPEGTIRNIASNGESKTYKKLPNYDALARGLEKFGRIAASDSPLAVIAQSFLLDLARLAVRLTNDLAKAQPAQWQELAERESYWPVNISLHPYNVKGMEADAKVRDFLENCLHLGKHCVPTTDASSKWSMTSPITRQAVGLVGHVWKARDVAYFCRTQNIPLSNGWRREAGDLPEWNKDSAKQWADVAIKAFRETYPNPEQIKELADEIGAHFSTDKESEEGISADSMSTGRARDRILHRLRKAIYDIAPK